MEAFRFTSADGLQLNGYRSFIPDAKANIIFVHGFFSHAGRYKEEAKNINAQGYNFYSYDHRTHGLSEGEPRSYISSFHHYLADLEKYFKELDLGERDNILMSHSFGGLVVCSYIIEDRPLPSPFKGLIFSSPFLLPDENTAPLLQKMAGIVGTLLPKLRVVELDSNEISNLPEEIGKYKTDPLIFQGKMYSGAAWQMLKQIKKIESGFSNIELPLLILHGTNDKIANPTGAVRLYEQAKSKDKQLIKLDGQKHEVLKDTDRVNTWQSILEWAENHI